MDETNYRAKQSKKDKQYAAEYAKFIESLPPDERKKYEELGLAEPKIDGTARKVGMTEDLSKYAVTVDTAHPEEESEESDENAVTHATAPVKADSYTEHLGMIAAIFIQSKSPRMEAVALCFATSLNICSIWGGVQAEAARRLNLPRQNLSKSVSKWRRVLNLPANRLSSGESTREALSAAQKAKHWRRKKFKASNLKIVKIKRLTKQQPLIPKA
jgi:hypothetical protein